MGAAWRWRGDEIGPRSWLLDCGGFIELGRPLLVWLGWTAGGRLKAFDPNWRQEAYGDPLRLGKETGAQFKIDS